MKAADESYEILLIMRSGVRALRAYEGGSGSRLRVWRCGDGLKPDAMYRFAGAKSESYCLIVLDICALNVVTVACRCDHNWSV